MSDTDANPVLQIPRKRQECVISGCGGGFDIVSGLPIHSWLKAAGKQVVLANLSFSRIDLACRERIGPSGWVVDGSCEPMSYFPERHLSEWLTLCGRKPDRDRV